MVDTESMLSGRLTHVSAQTGLETSGDSLHSSIDIWIIALQITVVEKRA